MILGFGGNIGQIVDATRSETLTFTYDELDRLDTVSGPYSHNYDYNPIGNITAKNTTTYTYGSAAHKHAVSALSTGESYSYDPNGNMTQRVEGGSTYSQTFDTENRLVSVQVGSQTTQFLYDPDGNLVKKIKPGGSRTLYVGGIYEVDKSSGGSVTRTVTYYPVAGAMRINSTVYYTLKDHLGSASVTTDSAGTIVGEDRFYPFGETRFTTGTMQTDKLFTGQREMAGLGIYHYGARFYSPKLGRFLSADSIVPGFANPQNLNRFSYVRNNPLRYTDSTGHWIDQGCGCTGNTRIAAPKPIVKGGPLVGNTDVAFKPAPKPSTPATGGGLPSLNPGGASPVKDKNKGGSSSSNNIFCNYLGIGCFISPGEISIPVQIPQNATATPQPSTATPQQASITLTPLPGTPTPQPTQGKRGLTKDELGHLNKILNFDVAGYMATHPDVPRETAGWRNPKGRHDLETLDIIAGLTKSVRVLQGVANNPNVYESAQEEALSGAAQGQTKIATLTAWMNSEIK